MSAELDRALHTFRTTGRVALAGAPSVWARAVSVLVVVLIALICVLIVGVLVGLPMAIVAGLKTTPMTFFGAISVVAMLVGLLVWVLSVRRRNRRYLAAERKNIVLDGHGLTVRGIGPIPWADFGPAGYRLVAAEYDSGLTRRAVMELTASGLHNVNSGLAPEQRRALSASRGTIWRAPVTRYINVPGAHDLSQGEVIDLINAARALVFGVTGPRR